MSKILIFVLKQRPDIKRFQVGSGVILLPSHVCVWKDLYLQVSAECGCGRVDMKGEDTYQQRDDHGTLAQFQVASLLETGSGQWWSCSGLGCLSCSVLPKQRGGPITTWKEGLHWVMWDYVLSLQAQTAWRTWLFAHPTPLPPTFFLLTDPWFTQLHGELKKVDPFSSPLGWLMIGLK